MSKAPEIDLQAELVEFEQRLGGEDRALVYRARKAISRLWLGHIELKGISERVLSDEA